MIAPRAYRPVNTTTQRLVQRIMEDWWADVCNEHVAPVVGVHLDKIQIGPDNVAVAIAAESPPKAASPKVSTPINAESVTVLSDSTSQTTTTISASKPISKGDDADRGVLCA
jgi:hypothetical protein